jgi:hypothetical protein
MLDQYTASQLALGAAHREMTSARPDAPVLPTTDRPRPDGRALTLTRTRARLASALHRVAAVLEPAEGRDRRVATTVEASTACR